MRPRLHAFVRSARANVGDVALRAHLSEFRRIFVRRLNALLMLADVALVQLDDERTVDALVGLLRNDLLAHVDDLEGQLADVRAVVAAWHGGSATKLISKINAALGPAPTTYT